MVVQHNELSIQTGIYKPVITHLPTDSLIPPMTPLYKEQSWPVPSQLPTKETGTLIPMMIPPGKQGPPTGSIAGMSNKALKLATFVALSILVIFILLLQIRLPDIIVVKPIKTKHSGKCILPAYPEHGTYKHPPAAKPGDSFESLNLTVVCLPGYGVLGIETVYCDNGSWSDYIPKCVRFCKLNKHTSVHYHCLVAGSNEDYRACDDYEPSGTVVRPECNSPNYYSPVIVPSMTCIDGRWDRAVVCSPECGRVAPKGEPLIPDWRPAKQEELPWHVGIYQKNKKPYMQICGGSIISERRVISVAHCFWDDGIKRRPASDFAVAAGKIYRAWNNPRDAFVQKSDVKEIAIPDGFKGSAANFQDDIAVIILENTFIYNSFVRPICMDFNFDFDRRQLQPGKLGKVAGWGLTAENGNPSKILKVIDLPYMSIEKCFAVSPPSFTGYITSDKICADHGNGSALCKGDGGGGLAFPESEGGVDRYYLRGIVSTAPTSENLCKTKTITTFTHILAHEYFIREYL